MLTINFLVAMCTCTNWNEFNSLSKNTIMSVSNQYRKDSTSFVLHLWNSASVLHSGVSQFGLAALSMPNTHTWATGYPPKQYSTVRTAARRWLNTSHAYKSSPHPTPLKKKPTTGGFSATARSEECTGNWAVGRQVQGTAWETGAISWVRMAG